MRRLGGLVFHGFDGLKLEKGNSATAVNRDHRDGAASSGGMNPPARGVANGHGHALVLPLE